MLDLVRRDSLQNIIEDGKKVGFKFAVRIGGYRGCYVSLVNGYYINMDGVEYSQDQQKFEINGKSPRSYAEIKKAVWEHWNYDDEAFIHVKKDGGLGPGKHTLLFAQSILEQYGYARHDEEWVKNPPIPGDPKSGMFGKADILKFELELAE